MKQIEMVIDKHGLLEIHSNAREKYKELSIDYSNPKCHATKCLIDAFCEYLTKQGIEVRIEYVRSLFK